MPEPLEDQPPVPGGTTAAVVSIGQLNDLIEAAAYVVQLGNQPGMDDDEWEAAFTSLEAAVVSVQTAKALRAALASPAEGAADVELEASPAEGAADLADKP